MLNNNITSRFSYLIRPTTPCIFGTENLNDQLIDPDDEFFITAGGIIHSCPNIYELSNENKLQYRKLQSCEHLIFINKNLNTYDTKFSHYSILPRFQPMSSSLSTDSINSEIELYKERHANGLSRIDDHTSSFPTTWKSDISVQSSLSISIDSNKRSRSFTIPIGQTISSCFVVL